MTKIKKAMPWSLAVIIALIFLQSLFFKFTGDPMSREIFQTIEGGTGLAFFEPVMRYVTGAMELVAAILLLIPATQFFGALLALVIIIGALFFHLTSLGIVVAGDASLFGMAVLVLFASSALLYIRRSQLQKIKKG